MAIIYHHSRPSATLAKPKAVRFGPLLLRIGLLSATVVLIMLDRGFREPVLPSSLNHLLQFVFVLIYGIRVWYAKQFNKPVIQGEQLPWMDATILSLAAMAWLMHMVLNQSWAFGVFDLAVVMLLMLELWRLNVGLSRLLVQPGMLLPISFLFLIAVGTPLLKLPLATPPGESISWLDAMFTITSAVCVTGLTTVDTTHFTPLGQSIIGVFIQIGGLGIVIFGSLLAMLMGARLSLREHVSLSQMLNDQPVRRIASLVRIAVLSTLIFELIGAVLLMPMWDPSLPASERFGLSLFHSVSAYCNAGFALQSDSMAQFRSHPQMHLVIAPLIILGGLGLPVLDNLFRVARNRVRDWWRNGNGNAGISGKAPVTLPRLSERRLNLHTKVVLSTTLALYLVGMTAFAIGQLQPYYRTMGSPPAQTQTVPPLTTQGAGQLLLDSSFMSITARTAGFNTVPMEELEPSSTFVLMTLMTVGGSPGGTAGGVKTTTLALIVLSIIATLRRRRDAEAFSRRIDDSLVRRAATIAFSFVALVSVSTFLLLLFEPYALYQVLFEAVSAASTTGLSLGITPHLTDPGKIVIILTMFLGRVGPLAMLGLIFFGARAPKPYAYPAEEVVMG